MIVRPLKDPGRVISGTDSQQLKSGYVELEAGQEVGSHSTAGGEEILVLMEGEAEVSCGAEVVKVRAPAAVLVPPRTVHNVKNVSSSRLRYVYVVSLATPS